MSNKSNEYRSNMSFLRSFRVYHYPNLVLILILSLFLIYLSFVYFPFGESNYDFGYKDTLMGVTLSETSKDSTEDDFFSQSHTPVNHKEGPNIEYEKLRFRLYENTLHLSNFVHWKLAQILEKHQSLKQDKSLWRSFNEVFDEYIRFNLKDVASLAEVDGFDYWRQQQSEKLEDLIRRRLDALQNPDDFQNAKKLQCILINAGYTAIMFRFAQCLFVAYGTGRTMVLKSNWSFNNFNWIDTFIPPFKSYAIEGNVSWSKWPGDPSSQVIIYDGTNRSAPIMPMYLPEDLAATILRTHSSLPVFWLASQFLKYLWRPRPEIKNMMTEWEHSIGFKKPVVGIHVRRSDKITAKESRFYALEEYMYHVEEFYKTYELDHFVDQKHVYIATDDENVFKEMRQKYPQYKVLGDEKIARDAVPSHRGTNVSLHGLLKDVHIMSLTDLVVCDFKSNVCRLVYAIKQFQNKNAATQIRAVGRFYDQGHFGTMHKAIRRHSSSNLWELQLQVNDVIENIDYFLNGTSIGTNLRTGLTGIYPTIKVIPFDGTYNFPTYPQVPIVTEK